MKNKTISHDTWHFLIPFLLNLLLIPLFFVELTIYSALWLTVVLQVLILALGFAYDWAQIFSDLDELYGGLDGFRHDSAMDILYMFLGMAFGGIIGLIIYLVINLLRG